MHKIIKLGGVLLLFSLLLGCQKKALNSEQVITKHLQKKYAQEFQIQQIETKNIGQNYAKYVEVGEASLSDSTDQTFSFTLYDNGTITDNYPMLLFGDKISKDVHSILDSSNIECSNISIKFLESDQTYTSFSDYKNNYNILICGDLKSTDKDRSSSTHDTYRLLSTLKDNGYYFLLTVTIEDIKKTIIYDHDIDMLSEESFVQKFQ